MQSFDPNLPAALFGSMLAVRLGAKLIRPLPVTIACAMAVRLLSDPAPLARGGGRTARGDDARPTAR